MRTLVIFNHPYDGSYCNAILDAVILGIERSNGEVDLIHLDKEGFDPVMSSNDLKAFGLARNDAQRALGMLDKKVIEYKERLEKAEHLVFIFPTWWMLMPALTKGFIDKVIFPEVAYNYDEDGSMKSLLKKLRRVTVISTMETPSNVYETIFGNAIWRALNEGTFKVIGIENCKWIKLDMVKRVGVEKRKMWLKEIEEYFYSNRENDLQI